MLLVGPKSNDTCHYWRHREDRYGEEREGRVARPREDGGREQIPVVLSY